ncbi:helix-turn-helix domain-containing protein [Mycolicibacterium sp. S2-37]|uniref:helix-turn-helix domain-containing protein n=1 Tax=Mycolicibacterium sp. S2-37 TaxID=2810297 RepID=UPI0027DA35B4|nr:helix-turn-helix domain-containing protein [Mycolicibacterium sp. S2-37]
MNKHNTTELDTLPARMTIQLAADTFDVSARTIRRWIAAGRIKAYRLGTRTIRIDRDSLLAMQRPMGSAA